jgi:predicted DNA-binding transcriptional regulator
MFAGYDLDPRGYNFSVCVHRINKDLGISREAVFRCLAGMIEVGYLVREQIDGFPYIKPPSSVRSISEVLENGKRKVLA